MAVKETHRMEANYLPTGGVILHCPACGYRVQINPIGPNKTLDVGEAATVLHVWTATEDLVMGPPEGSKEPPTPKRVQMHVAEFGCATDT